MTSNKRRPMIGNLLTNGQRCPTSPLELKILSPTGIVNCHFAGVGLAIVAALHNTTTTTSPLNQPAPKHHHHQNQTSKKEEEYMIMQNNSYTNNLYDDVGFISSGRNKSRETSCLFDIISPSLDHIKCYPSHFLNSCHLCNKKLHGKDIYMYRGEKAFCSIECLSRKIRTDERREKHCSTEAVYRSHGQKLSTGIFAL